MSRRAANRRRLGAPTSSGLGSLARRGNRDALLARRDEYVARAAEGALAGAGQVIAVGCLGSLLTGHDEGRPVTSVKRPTPRRVAAPKRSFRPVVASSAQGTNPVAGQRRAPAAAAAPSRSFGRSDDALPGTPVRTSATVGDAGLAAGAGEPLVGVVGAASTGLETAPSIDLPGAPSTEVHDAPATGFHAASSNELAEAFAAPEFQATSAGSSSRDGEAAAMARPGGARTAIAVAATVSRRPAVEPMTSRSADASSGRRADGFVGSDELVRAADSRRRVARHLPDADAIARDASVRDLDAAASPSSHAGAAATESAEALEPEAPKAARRSSSASHEFAYPASDPEAHAEDPTLPSVSSADAAPGESMSVAPTRRFAAAAHAGAERGRSTARPTPGTFDRASSGEADASAATETDVAVSVAGVGIARRRRARGRAGARVDGGLGRARPADLADVRIEDPLTVDGDRGTTGRTSSPAPGSSFAQHRDGLPVAPESAAAVTSRAGARVVLINEAISEASISPGPSTSPDPFDSSGEGRARTGGRFVRESLHSDALDSSARDAAPAAGGPEGDTPDLSDALSKVADIAAAIRGPMTPASADGTGAGRASTRRARRSSGGRRRLDRDTTVARAESSAPESSTETSPAAV